MHSREHFVNKYSASNLWIQKKAPIKFNVIKQTKGKGEGKRETQDDDKYHKI